MCVRFCGLAVQCQVLCSALLGTVFFPHIASLFAVALLEGTRSECGRLQLCICAVSQPAPQRLTAAMLHCLLMLALGVAVHWLLMLSFLVAWFALCRATQFACCSLWLVSLCMLFSTSACVRQQIGLGDGRWWLFGRMTAGFYPAYT